jgi:hypothetical protein
MGPETQALGITPTPRPSLFSSDPEDLPLKEVEVSHGICKRAIGLLQRPIAWIVLTAIVAIVVYAAARPPLCTDVARCSQLHSADSTLFSLCVASALGAIFLHELVCLILTYRTARAAMHIIPNVREAFIPSTLLCITFAVLVVENAVFVIGNSPWYVNSERFVDQNLSGQPVYTVFYVEWLINVPILLILAGHYALLRPMKEVASPLIITNVYISLAWAAHFADSYALRYSLVAISFIMYGWASFEMIRWVKAYSEAHQRARLLGRPFLCIVLIIVFGIYGIVYGCRLAGVVDPYSERIFYTAMNAGTKLVASMAFAGIRSNAYHDLLLDMLVNTNTVFQRSFGLEKMSTQERQEF